MAQATQTVKSSKIHVVDNPRENVGNLSDLKEDIRENGLLHPLLVCPHPEKKGEFLLIDGQRRLLCLKEIRKYDIDVVVNTKVDPDIAMMSANIHRENLSPLDKARGIQKLMEKKKFKAKQVAAKLHISQGLVSQLLKLLEQPKEIQKAVVEGKITPTAVRELSRIANEKAKLKLSRQAEGMPIDDVKELVRDQLDREKRTSTKNEEGKRRGRPTRKETSKPKPDPDARYKDFEMRDFRSIFQAYAYTHYSIAADKKRRSATVKIPKELKIKRKEYSPTEEAFLEGAHQMARFVLGLAADLDQKGLDKMQLPVDPFAPKGDIMPQGGKDKK